MGIFSGSSEGNFRSYVKQAKKTEKYLDKYYKKNFIRHTRRLDELYKNHLESLKRIDGSMGSMNSMVKIFKQTIPNGMKQRNISIETIKKYLNDEESMKLKDYSISSKTTKMDFVEQHIRRQVNGIINTLFEKKHRKNIKQILVNINEPQSGEEGGIYRKSHVKEGQYTILGIKTGIKRDSDNILNMNLLEVILIFKLNNNKLVKHTIPHIGFKIIKDRAYEIIKKMIEMTLTQQEQQSLKSYAKKQDEKLKSIIFEEQKKLLEDQVKQIDKEGDNQKILLNIVKRIHKSSKDKSYMDDFGGRTIGSTGSSGQVIGFGSRTELGDDEDTTIERKLEQQMDKPLAELDEEEQNETDKLFDSSPIGTDDPNNIPELVDMFKEPSKKKGGRLKIQKTKKLRTSNNKKISPHNKKNTELNRRASIKKHKHNPIKSNKIKKRTRKNKSIKMKKH
jgi:hypothetical protein